MSKSVTSAVSIAALLLAGCGEGQSDPKPRPQQVAAEDYDDIVTDCESGGPEIDPALSDEELAELKQAYLEGREAAPPPEARAEVDEPSPSLC